MTNETNQTSVRLSTPWGGFATLHIGKYKIGIAIGTEEGTQSATNAGEAFEDMIKEYNELLRKREAYEKYEKENGL